MTSQDATCIEKKSRIIHFLSTSNVLEKLLNMYEKWIGNRFNRIHQRPSNWSSTSKNWKFELCEPHLCSATSVDFIASTGKWNFLRGSECKAIKVALQFFIWNGNSSGQKWLPGEKWFCHTHFHCLQPGNMAPNCRHRKYHIFLILSKLACNP